MAYAHHRLDLYGIDLFLATNRRDWNKLQGFLRFLDDVPESAGMAEFAVYTPESGPPRMVGVLWIDMKQHDTESILVNTCAHEATHLATQLNDHIGHRPNSVVDEPTAYLVGWVTEWLWNNCPNVKGAA